MDIQVKGLPEKSQAELKVTVPAGDFAPFLDKAAQKISKKHPSKGFRPGKAPVAAVVDMVGQDHLLQEAIDAALPHFFVEAAIAKDVEAINRPNISVDSLSLKGDLSFTATVDVMPSVTIGDPKKIKLERREVEVTDEQIQKELEYLAGTRAKMDVVDRAAVHGDTASVDFEISVDGTIIEGGSSKNHPVELGGGRFVPDFENGILGITAEETREFDMQFPDDYGNKGLRGKKARAKVTAIKVEKKVVPEINDAFAKELGTFKDLADLKNKLRENTEREETSREQERYLNELAEKLMELSEFGLIPDSLIDREVDSRLMEFAQMLQFQQQSFESYLEREGKTLEEMRSGMKETAQKRVKVGLMLRALAKQESIEVSEAEIEAEATKELAQFKTVEQAQQHVDPAELRERVENVLKNRKTLERIAEMMEA